MGNDIPTNIKTKSKTHIQKKKKLNTKNRPRHIALTSRIPWINLMATNKWPQPHPLYGRQCSSYHLI